MSELDDQIAHRKAKLATLREAGIDPFPRLFEHDLEPAGVHRRFVDKTAEELVEEPVSLRVPGRVQAIREHGKTVFADISDGSAKLQVLIRSHKLEEDSARVLANLDLGDYLGVSGDLMRTRTGELTLTGEKLEMLAKALRPMPEKYHGLADTEARYRQRYLDLISNPESRRVFEVRAALLRGMRAHLDGRDFLEVETPMMQPLAGGATARPFTTHHNALDLDLYLRVAPELFLKRLLVGGLHKVYEINRNFRNEGISTQHNPEFTMLELYWAYADYRDIMALVEELFITLATSILGEPVLNWKGERLELAAPWPRLTMLDATAKYGEIDPAKLQDVADLTAELERRGAELPRVRDWGHLLLALFEEVAEPHLNAPTFIIDHPVEISPLAKQKADDPRMTERFELYIGGMELANAFSELNDPEVQADRFRGQLAARELGDDEAQRYDEDYILALEHGMPPAGGLGIGIDRMTMLFTDRASIRDVILFPLLRPQA